jgi:hypothetical protein
VGPEFQVSTFTTNWQSKPSVAALKNGGFVVTWESSDQEGAGYGYGVYGQRYNAAGAKAGAEFRVNTYKKGFQLNPSVAALSNGGFVVTWESWDGQDGSATGIYGQRYSPAGAKVGVEFRVNTYKLSEQYEPSVAGLGNGGFVVTWASNNQDGSQGGVYGQRYSAAGAKVGVEFRANTFTADLQSGPSVAGLSNGGFVVTWSSRGQDGAAFEYGVYGQRYSAAGARVGGEFRVNTYKADDQLNPSVTGLSNGGFVVTWHSYLQDGSGYGVYGQRYNAAGAKAGGNFRVNTFKTNNQSGPSVTALTDGGFVVTWHSDGQDGSKFGVYGQRYTAAGAKAGIEFLVNTYTADDQGYPSIAGLSNGGFVVTWASYLQDGSLMGVYGQRYDQ